MDTTQTARPAAADVALLAAAYPLSDVAAAALPSRAGGARVLTRAYSYLLSSHSADTCGPMPHFNTARGAGVAGDAVRAAQPGIEYVLLVRDRSTDEWRTLIGGLTIPAAIEHHWPAS